MSEIINSDSKSDFSLSEIDSVSKSDFSHDQKEILNLIQSLKIGDFVRFFTLQDERACIGEVLCFRKSGNSGSAIEIKNYNRRKINEV